MFSFHKFLNNYYCQPGVGKTWSDQFVFRSDSIMFSLLRIRSGFLNLQFDQIRADLIIFHVFIAFQPLIKSWMHAWWMHARCKLWNKMFGKRLFMDPGIWGRRCAMVLLSWQLQILQYGQPKWYSMASWIQGIYLRWRISLLSFSGSKCLL